MGRRDLTSLRIADVPGITDQDVPIMPFAHFPATTRMSFGSTPAIRSKSRSRCRSGMPPRIAWVAIRQSFAERGVTPAHRHRAYKCAALRAASRASGAMTIGNSPSTRSQRANRSPSRNGIRAECWAFAQLRLHGRVLRS